MSKALKEDDTLIQLPQKLLFEEKILTSGNKN